ncbi:MAG: O-antigen ligase family protein [Planctomycetes bacterium]|nr:O-antigen ligase family protein [Planctomycetota bacterium]
MGPFVEAVHGALLCALALVLPLAVAVAPVTVTTPRGHSQALLDALVIQFSLVPQGVLLTAAATALGVLAAVDVARRGVGVERTAPFAGLLLYLAFLGVSIAGAVNPWEAEITVERACAYGVLAWSAARFVRTRRRLVLLLAAQAAGGAVISILGLWQYVVWATGVDVREGFWAAIHGVPGATRDGRAVLGWGFSPVNGMAATLGVKNIAAAYVNASLPAALGLFLLARRPALRRAAAVAAFACVLYVLLAKSRTAWAALALGALVVLAAGAPLAWARWRTTRARLAVAGSVAAFAVAVWAGASGLVNVFGQPGRTAEHEEVFKATFARTVASFFEPGGDKGRFKRYRESLPMLGWNAETGDFDPTALPLFGVGAGNWKFHYPRHVTTDWEPGVPRNFTAASQPRRLHSDHLETLIEAGWLAFAAYTLFFGGLFVAAARLARRADLPGAPAASLALLLAVTVALAHGAVDFPREFIAVTAAFYVIAGAVLGYGRAVTAAAPAAAPVATAPCTGSGSGNAPSVSVSAAVPRRGRVAGRVASGAALALAVVTGGGDALWRWGDVWRARRFERLADEAARLGDTYAAREHMAQACAAWPFDHELQHKMSLFLLATEAPDRALDHAEACLALHPNFINAHNVAGVCHFRRHEFREAREAFLSGLAVHRADYDLLVNLGRLEFEEGDEQRALELFQEAFQNDPKGAGELGADVSREALQEIAEIQLRRGRHDEVLRLLAFTWREADSVRYSLEVARVETARGDLPAAHRWLRTALRLAPDRWDVRARYARFLHEHYARDPDNLTWSRALLRETSRARALAPARLTGAGAALRRDLEARWLWATYHVHSKEAMMDYVSIGSDPARLATAIDHFQRAEETGMGGWEFYKYFGNAVRLAAERESGDDARRAILSRARQWYEKALTVPSPEAPLPPEPRAEIERLLAALPAP